MEVNRAVPEWAAERGITREQLDALQRHMDRFNRRFQFRARNEGREPFTVGEMERIEDSNLRRRRSRKG